MANAFNSLPWPVIREAMIRKGFPEYIRRIIDSYLSGRTIEYALEGGRIGVKKMTAGVPQGSILGPLLWNIGYDYVLQTELDPGCRVICYADDTMVISTANNMEDLIDKANSMISKVIGRTRELGLKVSPSKTEVVLFYGRTRPKEVAKVTVEGETIVAKDCMKYLGIILDNRLNFKEHFRYIEKKTTKVVRALSGLMPNLKGPGEHKRRLYANVVTSVLTYGAPVWSDALGACKKNQAPLRRLSRTLAVRVVSAYRTISYEAATLLARMPPLPLLARLRKRVYYRLKDLHRKGEWSRETEKEIRAGEELLLRRQWQIHLNDAGLAGARTRDAIRPVLDEWIDRKQGSMVFHLTQLLSGHGCFNAYLYKIKKIEDPTCSHCRTDPDTAEHTLQDCVAWLEEREELQRWVGQELSLGEVIKSVVRDTKAWEALTRFAQSVMRNKEEAERERERGNSERMRRRTRCGPDPNTFLRTRTMTPMMTPTTNIIATMTKMSLRKWTRARIKPKQEDQTKDER